MLVSVKKAPLTICPGAVALMRGLLTVMTSAAVLVMAGVATRAVDGTVFSVVSVLLLQAHSPMAVARSIAVINVLLKSFIRVLNGDICCSLKVFQRICMQVRRVR